MSVANEKSILLEKKGCKSNLKSETPIRFRKPLAGRSRKNRDRDGATMVELAVILPIIVLILFSSIEFARMLMIRQALTNAAREGCRDACLATRLSSADCEDFIRLQLRKVIADATSTDEEGVSDSCLRVTITPSFTNGIDTRTTVTANVEVNCSDVSWFPLTIFSNAKIRCSAQMIRE